MSQFDMISKRAERLLRKNWTSVVAEAHRLGGLGLPGLQVDVTEDSVILRLYPETLPRGYYVRIVADGSVYAETTIQWQDGHWETDDVLGNGVQDVALALSAALEEAQNRASKMGDIAQELTKIR
ncbi:MAG: hypothetical protein PHF44_03285 [Candidatus Pacebacteria bacterium]|nr:hypothetical protein [Candidatus Paceibacterota bacterium]